MYKNNAAYTFRSDLINPIWMNAQTRTRIIQPNRGRIRGHSPVITLKKRQAISARNFINQNRSLFSYKMIWTIFMATSMLVCSYQLYDRINLYNSEPVTSLVTIQKMQYIKFPSFTVCPMTTYIPKLQQFLDIKGINLTGDICEWTPTNTEPIYYMEKDNTGIANYIGYYVLYPRPKVKSMAALKLNKTLVNERGSCKTYSLNYAPAYIESYAQEFEVETLPLNETLMCSDENIALEVFIHDDNVDPRFGHNELAYVEFATTKTISLAVKEFHLLNTKSKPCVSTEERQMCQLKCTEEMLTKLNTCRPPLPEGLLDSLKPCTEAKKSLKSIKAVFVNIKSSKSEEFCQCLPACHERIYMSYMDENRIIAPGSNGYFKARFTHNIGTVVEDILTYTLVSCICDIGGNLGLFMGLSIPSIFSLVEFSVQYYQRRKLSKRQKP